MRIRNLLYLLLALPLAFAACEEPEQGVDEPQKEAVLTLTSESTMEFEAVGGQGTITYTAEMREVTREADGTTPKISVSCEADWVALGNPDFTKVEFTVAENEGEARDTKVVVNYATKNFEVTIKQAAKSEKPEPKPEYAMDVEMAVAVRIPSTELNLTDNYFALAFSDDAENIQLGIMLVGTEGENILQAGNYASNNDTLLTEDCEVFVWEPAAEYTFTEGTTTVALKGEIYTFDIELSDEDGKLYHFIYEGVVIDMVPADKPEAENFTPIKVEAYRSESWDTGNFELDLYIDEENHHSLDMQDIFNPNNDYLTDGLYTIENGGITSWSNFIHNIETGEGAYIVDAEIDIKYNNDGTTTLKGFFESEYGKRLNIDWTGVIDGFNYGGESEYDKVFNATHFGGEHYNIGIHNYYICLSDAVADGSLATEGATYYYFDLYSNTANSALSVPNGVYEFDTSNSYSSGTFTEEYGYGFLSGPNSSVATWYLYAEGSTVTVTDGKIVADLILTDGTRHLVTYEGDLALSDLGGGGIEEDIEFNETGMSIIATYYDQYYSNDTDNWFIEILEDPETGNGKYFLFDLLADYATSVDYRGTFTASFDYGINTFVPGYIDEGYLMGCWYAELTDGEATGTMVPMTEGTITVTFNDDGTQTFVLDCVDDAGHKVTGSITGTPYSEEYSMNTLQNNAAPRRGAKIQKVTLR